MSNSTDASTTIVETLFERTRTNLLASFEGFDLKKALRLIIIIGGYILIRNIGSRELAKRKLQNEVRRSQQEKSDKNQENLIEKPGQTSGSTSAMPFGWGNKTRKRRKEQQEAFADLVERINKEKKKGNDLEDIEDLLED